MDIKQAYGKLDVSPDISDEDLKKKWRTLAKEYHPDINKDHPEKLKEINEAYQAIQDHRKNPFKRSNVSDESDFPFNVGDIFSGFHGYTGFNQQSKQRRVNNISLNIEISFKESILGAEKDIEFDREIKCAKCNGNGFSQKHNGCNHCDGSGHSTSRQGNAIFSTTCGYCRGKDSREDCQACNKKTFASTKAKMKVKIPAGIQDKNTMQLQGAGHFAGSSMFGEAYSSVLLTVNVKNDTALKLDGNDVIYNLSVSLLEALEGCQKTVPTINGEQEIKILALSKNKEEVTIKNMGVNLIGHERIILDVNYPEDKEKLISILKEGN